MDQTRFDAVTGTLTSIPTRRDVLRGLAGVGLGLGGLRLADVAEGGRKHKNAKRKKKHQKGSCTPNCDRKICGDDGCGGSCGGCPTDYTCQGGICVCPSPRTLCAGGACINLLSNANHCGACGHICAGVVKECRHGYCCQPNGSTCICAAAGSACDAETCCHNGGVGACLPTGVCP